MTVLRGSSTALVADVRGLAPVFQWFVGDPPVPVVDGPRPSGAVFSGSTTETLSILNARPSVSGTYFCRAMDQCGREITTMPWAPATVTVTCIAEFDGNLRITVQDVFSYLTAWFARDPGADFNDAGGVTVNDLFEYLGAWFEEAGLDCRPKQPPGG